MSERWLILRVFAGLPLIVEKTINENGLATAYVPKEVIKRRHPKGKHVIVQRKPLLPGYLFASQHFDVQAINTTRTKAKWLTIDGRMAYLTERQMESLRTMEQSWRPGFDDFIHALQEISRGVKPKTSRYVSWGEWREGRAA